MEKKLKKKGPGHAIIIPAFVKEALSLDKGTRLKMVVGFDNALRLGKKLPGLPFGFVSVIKPVCGPSLNIHLPKIWVDHHRLGVGDKIDISLGGNEDFIIQAVKE